jgi:hypothetical protein
MAKSKETNEVKKPKVKLVGQDSNVFGLISLAQKALRKAGLNDQAKEMQAKCFKAGSYHEAIAVIMEYCEVS